MTEFNGINGIKEAFNKFMSEAVKSAILSSTKASWGGSFYWVELFSDGDYQILGDGSIGNLYDSPGILLSIPALDDDCYDEDEDLIFYNNAMEELEAKFNEKLENGFEEIYP
jgi:hypothetical protein